MNSRYIPIDCETVGKVELRAVFPKSVFQDGQMTGEQEVDRATGLPKWKVMVHFCDEYSLNGVNGGRSGDQSGVTVTSVDEPLAGAERGTQIRLDGLTYMVWTGGDGQPHEALRALSASVVK